MAETHDPSGDDGEDTFRIVEPATGEYEAGSYVDRTASFSGTDSEGGGNDDSIGGTTEGGGKRKKRSDAGQRRGSRRASVIAASFGEGPVEDPNAIRRDIETLWGGVGKSLAQVAGKHWELDRTERQMLTAPTARLLGKLSVHEFSTRGLALMLGGMAALVFLPKAYLSWVIAQQLKAQLSQGHTPVPDAYRRAFEQQAQQPQNPDSYRKVADPNDRTLFTDGL